MAGRCRARHLQPPARRIEVGGADGVAVHGGDGGRRLVAARLYFGSEHAAQGPVEGHPLGRHEAEALEHARLRLTDREHA